MIWRNEREKPMGDDKIILGTIDRFWEARLAGDKATLRSFFSPDATYEMVGAKALADRIAAGPVAAGPAADSLIDDFKFHSVERLTAIVDGAKAATVNRLQVSYRGGTPVTSEACDIWEFDASGKATSLRQFVDSDLVRRMIDGAV
jgi:ketosteroid isomerase-like protein